jgi:hypothetical protein
VSDLSKALGVGTSITNVEWMKASARTTAYGRNDGEIVEAPDMTAAFGMLGAEDNYFLMSNDAAFEAYPGAGGWASPGPTLASATAFANHLRNGVSTLITATKFDLVVYTPEIPYAFRELKESEPSLGAILQGLVPYDQTAATGLPRPGAFWLNYASDGSDQRRVTMPHFYESGHGVTMRAPAELMTDARLWYLASPH